MNRIDQVFADSRAKGETLLMPFLTVGDPSPDITVELVHALEAGGADMIELGVPYSDPLADGPVIQRASGRALQHGINIEQCMQVASTARAQGSRIPFVLFTYYNPALQMGLPAFMDKLVQHDIDGIIIPDLPLEEDGEVRKLVAEHGIHLIPLVAPTSRARIAQIASGASGFIYCVSSLGVTGMRSQFADGVEEFLQTVKDAAKVPIAIGFGISNREQVVRFSQICDGVIVGSAFVSEIEKALPLLTVEHSREQGLQQIKQFAQMLKGR